MTPNKLSAGTIGRTMKSGNRPNFLSISKLQRKLSSKTSLLSKGSEKK